MPGATGFTGVDWSTRPAEQLSADLAAGPGTAPLTEAVEAWTELARELDRLVVEAKRVGHELRDVWDSSSGGAAWRALDRFPGWIDTLGRRAEAQAALTRAAAAAAEAARVAMPAASVVDEIRAAVADAIRAGLTSVMTGGLARTHRAERDLAAAAAQVMADYERDSTAAATAPVRHDRPPTLVRGTGGSGEHAQYSPTGTRAAGLPGLLAAPRVLGAFRPAAVTVPRLEAADGPTNRIGPGPGAEPVADTDPTKPASVGPVAPMAPVVGGRAGAATMASESPVITTGSVVRADEGPLTWAELATHDAVRVQIGATTDSDHTAV